MNNALLFKLGCSELKKNLTQEQLAEKIDVTRQTIGLIEKGKYNPSISLCIKIAKVLDKTLDDLFWEVERSDKT
ncbi:MULTISPECIES: helix-turn-helix transcriptional regulator [unclassified Clostridium]|uniref:helix-turn-helix transcriptional regulator n=1 Tax=unclassified Clostridium TaxID=2614128 RepID=UPI002079A9B8